MASDIRVWDGTAWVSLKGPQGNNGAPGASGTITIAGVNTLAPGQPATVTDSNPDPSIANLTFGIPQGAAGAAATITVGTVTSVAAGGTPTVTNSGTSSAAVLNFGLVKGDKGDAGSGVTIKGTLAGAATPLPTGATSGDMYILGSPVPTAAPNGSGGTKAEGDGIVWNGAAWTNVGPIRGPQGPQGNAGAAGTAATVALGTVTTGAAGSNVIITDSDPSPNSAVLNFQIPRGDQGVAGKNAEVFNQAATPTGMSQGAIWIVP